MATRKSASVEFNGNVTSVPRQRVADRVMSALRAEIVSGALPRGTRLPPERELATRFGISGPTLREAIRGLSALGLIEVRHGSGAYVAPNIDSIVAMSLGTLVQLEQVGLQDMLQLLGVLNTYAARLAIERADETDVTRVRCAAEATITSKTVDDVADAMIAFLTSFAKAAHDPFLYALTQFLAHLVVEVEISSHNRDSDEFWQKWSKSVGSKRMLMVECLEARDLAGLVAAVQDYHRTAEERIATVDTLREARLSEPILAAYLEYLGNSTTGRSEPATPDQRPS